MCWGWICPFAGLIDGLIGWVAKGGRNNQGSRYPSRMLFSVHSHIHTFTYTHIFTDDDDDTNNNNDIDLDELLSTGGNSGGSAASARNAERHTQLVDALCTAADISSEKRATKREAIFRRLFKALTQQTAGRSSLETVLKFRTDVVAACCHTSRHKAKPSEQYASCRVLEALGVLVNDDDDDCGQDHWMDVEPYLRRIVMSTHKAALVRGAALRALALTCLVGSNDPDVCDKVLDICQSVAQVQYRNHDVPAILRATALDCWALLLTTLEDVYISGKSDFYSGRGLDMLPVLQECLASSGTGTTGGIELRAAAGQCVALIHESRWNVLDDNDNHTSDNHTSDNIGARNITERQFTRGSWENTAWQDIMAEIQQQLSELSTLSTKQMSKRTKRQQRAAFREYAATVVDDESPEETIRLRAGNSSNSWSITTWRELVRVNFVRQSLQGGFQLQLLTNPTLQAILGVDASVLGISRSMSQVEKRLIMSKGSEAAKMAYMDMTKKRRVRTNVKNHFLTVDGDEL